MKEHIVYILVICTAGAALTLTAALISSMYKTRPLSKGAFAAYILRSFAVLPYWYIALLLISRRLRAASLITGSVFKAAAVILSALFIGGFARFVISELQRRAAAQQLGAFLTNVKSEREIDEDLGADS